MIECIFDSQGKPLHCVTVMDSVITLEKI